MLDQLKTSATWLWEQVKPWWVWIAVGVALLWLSSRRENVVVGSSTLMEAAQQKLKVDQDAAREQAAAAAQAAATEQAAAVKHDGATGAVDAAIDNTAPLVDSPDELNRYLRAVGARQR